MRKPVISCEISPKFDGVPTAYSLPLPQHYVNYRYQIDTIENRKSVLWHSYCQKKGGSKATPFVTEIKFIDYIVSIVYTL